MKYYIIKHFYLATTSTTSTTPIPTTTPTPTTTPEGATPPLPPTMAPGIGPCDNCKMINGIGFNPHPDDCDKFVQCYFGTKGQLRVAYRQCPFGQYWDQSVLTCRPSEYVECEKGNWLCMYNTRSWGGGSYKDSTFSYVAILNSGLVVFLQRNSIQNETSIKITL